MIKLVIICYIDNGKELFLLYCNKKENDVYEGKWILVGGKLEVGEIFDECVKCEILEEIYLIVKKMDFKGVIIFFEFMLGYDWYIYVFKVIDYEGELILDDEL